jgi:hypothetical protein
MARTKIHDSSSAPRNPNPKPTSSRLRMRARVSTISPSGTASRITRPISAGTATRYWRGSVVVSWRTARATFPFRACSISHAGPTERPTVAGSCESPCTTPSAPTTVSRVPVTAASRGVNRSTWPAIDSQLATARPWDDSRESSADKRSSASVRSIA